jgi:STE24 endopeptidase
MVNYFFIVILAALLVEFLLEVVASLLNLRALAPEQPPELEGIYEPEIYRKSQQYTRLKTYFGLLESTFMLVILLAFWFAGGFNWLDIVVRSWGFPSLINGLLYIGILALAYSAIGLPFSIYGTFVIEERFGFNRTTWHTFVKDNLKGLGLGALLGGLLLAAVLALFEHAGISAWLYCWAAVVVFSLMVQFIAPTWIMPLFNKFTPMAPGELRDAIMKYAAAVNFSVKNIFVMDGSKRSGKSNAFFTGFGHNRRIVLFDTLIAQHTIPELVAVLAHEVGHNKKKHIIKGTAIGILHTGLLFFLLSLFLGSDGLYQAFGVEHPSIYTGLIFFGLLYTPLEVLLSMGMQIVSRRNEYQADRYAAETVEEPHSLITALKKLSSDNLSNLTPHPFYVFLNYSHPPLLQRVRAIEKFIRERDDIGAPMP